MMRMKMKMMVNPILTELPQNGKMMETVGTVQAMEHQRRGSSDDIKETC